MSGWRLIGEVHCAACTGKPRRRVIARVVFTAGDEVVISEGQKLHDDEGFIIRFRPYECPAHGRLDFSEADELRRDVASSFVRTGKFQHRALLPSTADGGP